MSDHRQELFNKVATHLLTQMETSYDGLGQCAYRGGGLRCAVGCLIADAHYDPDLEGRHAATDAVVNALTRSLGYRPTDDELTLLGELQDVHDDRDPRQWLDALRELAEERGLSMPEVTP